MWPKRPRRSGRTASGASESATPPRLSGAMQLSRRRRRPIEQSFRPEGPLVYARLSDPILVKRAKDGDERALAALCERHAPRVERIAFHILRDPEDARDAAQE